MQWKGYESIIQCSGVRSRLCRFALQIPAIADQWVHQKRTDRVRWDHLFFFCLFPTFEKAAKSVSAEKYKPKQSYKSSPKAKFTAIDWLRKSLKDQYCVCVAFEPNKFSRYTRCFQSNNHWRQHCNRGYEHHWQSGQPHAYLFSNWRQCS
jgi:hypothetical protein